jgi:uncharacterized membrane protein YphA (DoxX/SURF4 family)
MTISSRLARPMLASMFVAGGIDSYTNPEPKVKAADAVVAPLSARFPSFTFDTESVVRFNGAVQAGAGLLLAIGKFRRPAALVLAASIIPTTYAGHRFWEEADDTTRAQQRNHFLKNLGLLGGLILAATDTEGAPSISWRAKRQAEHVGEILASGRSTTSANGHAVNDRIHSLAHATQLTASELAASSVDVANRAAVRGQEAAGAVSTKAHETVRQANGVSRSAARRGRRAAEVAGDRLQDRVREATRTANQAAVRGQHVVAEANGRAHAATRRAARGAERARRAGLHTAGEYERTLADFGEGATGSIVRGAGRATDLASNLAGRGVNLASELVSHARESLSD